MVSLLLLTGLLAATATAQNATTGGGNATTGGTPSDAPCVSGEAVHMIIARASLEKPGPGVIGQVATQVVAQLPGSDSEDVVYPATLENYPQSEAAGVSAMAALLTAYAGRCPGSKIVMMGYSQGAQVAADTACGTVEGSLFATTQPAEKSVLDKGLCDLCWGVGCGVRAGSLEWGVVLIVFVCNSGCRGADGRPVQITKPDLHQRNLHQRWRKFNHTSLTFCYLPTHICTHRCSPDRIPTGAPTSPNAWCRTATPATHSATQATTSPST